MLPGLRRRLVCFYCGCKSAQVRSPDLRRWQCKRCEAVNHLDENGDITDPPATEDLPSARYAQSIQRPSSPLLNDADPTLFCNTCLKNQHLFSETIAGYFPPQDAPDYAEYEKQYPKYRKELEARYPQVCEACEPRVRERIRATGYAAKTDHLRRMMERSRDGSGSLAYARSNWKSIMIFIGGAGWFINLAGQVIWDALAIWSLGKECQDPHTIELHVSVSSCLHQFMRGMEAPPECATLTDPLARYSLLAGLLSLWWNPKMRERHNKNGGRMVGVAEYYKQQCILLAVRYGAWWYISGALDAGTDQQTMMMGCHLGLLFISGLITLVSFHTIDIDYMAQIVFQDSNEPLISQKPQVQLTNAGPGANEITAHPSQRHMDFATSNSGRKPFSISDLAPSQQTQSAYQSPYQPPTPPPEEDDEAMDWTPSQQPTLRPTSLIRPSSTSIQQHQSTPFRGHLPPDVVSMEHRLRNPPSKLTFRKATETMKQKFFKTPKKDEAQDLEYLSDTATDYEPSIAGSVYASTPTPAGYNFADPKLRLQSDQQAMTGLEPLLAGSFNLDDEPAEIRAMHQEQAKAKAKELSSTTTSFGLFHRLLVIFFSLASCAVWKGILEPSLGANQALIQLATVCFSGMISLRSIIVIWQQGQNSWAMSDMLLFLFELLSSIIIGTAVRKPSTDPLSPLRQEVVQTLGFWLMAAMTAQEAWMYYLDLTANQAVGIITLGLHAAPASFEFSAVGSELGRHQQQPPAPRVSSNRVATSRPAQPANPPNTGYRQTLELTQRTTRSRPTVEQSPTTGTDFGGLSLGGGPTGSRPLRRNNRNDAIETFDEPTLRELLRVATFTSDYMAQSVLNRRKDILEAESGKVIDFDIYNERVWDYLQEAEGVSSKNGYNAGKEASVFVIETIAKIRNKVLSIAPFGTKRSALETLRKIGETVIMGTDDVCGSDVINRLRDDGSPLEPAMSAIVDRMSDDEKKRMGDDKEWT